MAQSWWSDATAQCSSVSRDTFTTLSYKKVNEVGGGVMVIKVMLIKVKVMVIEVKIIEVMVIEVMIIEDMVIQVIDK